MSKIIATFDGLQITIKGAETVTAHQLYIASKHLAEPLCLVGELADGERTIKVLFHEFALRVYVTRDIEQGHFLALSAEFAMAAQFTFDSARLGGVIQATVQMTLQAMAQQAQNQQIMAKVKMTKGGVAVPH